ncbi:hypothetical protein, partial [Klebsiella oxytoca]|uniref:hypothetical protein n=1 Tax=Klebsiella oxytoca TaxID=571 RepID=UPI001952B376
ILTIFAAPFYYFSPLINFMATTWLRVVENIKKGGLFAPSSYGDSGSKVSLFTPEYSFCAL